MDELTGILKGLADADIVWNPMRPARPTANMGLLHDTGAKEVALVLGSSDHVTRTFGASVCTADAAHTLPAEPTIKGPAETGTAPPLLPRTVPLPGKESDTLAEVLGRRVGTAGTPDPMGTVVDVSLGWVMIGLLLVTGRTVVTVAGWTDEEETLECAG